MNLDNKEIKIEELAKQNKLIEVEYKNKVY